MLFEDVHLGQIADLPSAKLRTGVWSDGRNVVYTDGAAEKARGNTGALGSLSLTTIHLAWISDGTNIFWVYGSNTVLYATDGTTHALLSTSYAWAATDDLGWSGGPFHGWMLVNEGSRAPATWLPALSNDPLELIAWPASTTAKVLRTFKDFIFALRITDAGNYNPRLLRWSDLAAPGALPTSWDFTDPTNRAGRKEFGEDAGNLIDCLGLRDSLIVYKEGSTHIGRYVDLPDVWDFDELFTESGLLTENCVRAFKRHQHFAWTADDLIVHDGNSAESVADGRWRKWLFNRINTTRFRRCFVTADYRAREMWCCFPEAGSDWPNLALVWNWKEDNFSVRELGGLMTFGAHGIVPGASETFDSSSGTFDSDTGTFDEETYSPFAQRLLFAHAASQRAFQVGDSELLLSATMTSYVTRSYIPLVTTSPRRVKRVLSLAPLVHGDVGHTLSFYVGVRDTVDDAVVMQGPFNFVIGEDHKIDVVAADLSGRHLDLRCEHAKNGTWRLFGLDVEAVDDGER